MKATEPTYPDSRHCGFFIPPDATTEEVETLLDEIDALSSDGEAQAVLVAGSHGNPNVLADIWNAIAVGTLARKRSLRLAASGAGETATRGSSLLDEPLYWAGLSTARSIATDVFEKENLFEDRLAIAIRGKGKVGLPLSQTRAIVEFDPDFGDAPVLRGGDGFSPAPLQCRRAIFDQAMLRFVRELGLETIIGKASGRLEQASLFTFLYQLYKNGKDHGSRDPDGRTMRGTRFLRIRKHAAEDGQTLPDRCRGFPELSRYVDETLSRKGDAVFLEAAVSDLGQGMVDGFLTSSQGRGLANPREEVLDSLLHERLSAIGADPAAGLGIRKALQAAQELRAFVSLRTGEFWLTADLSSPDRPPMLTRRTERKFAKVAGTHWQLFMSNG